MNFLKTGVLCIGIALSLPAFSQVEKRKLAIKRISTAIKIDGVLDEAAWKGAPLADKFVELQPVPFRQESADNPTEIYFLYDNQGIYIGGYLHEKSKDSIASELIGRDGFGNNDFVGVIFDTYNDKLNGFEYFVTPLGEQWDAKASAGGNEDFSWNAVWQSKAKLQADGWSFEMFLPYSSIRFGKKKIQDWGMNIVRQRRKSGQKLFWQSIDPNANGFLTQEGFLLGLVDIKPPVRLQLSPYFSTYFNHDGAAPEGVKKSTSTINGGMDVKYGINQAFTLDMTLIPDFGQVPSDNVTLNLSPFEQRFSENRAFFTEGTELFNKGNLFYPRRIGIQPSHYSTINNNGKQTITDFEEKAKIINATKISGRTQRGLGIGILNAITKTQYATLLDTATGKITKQESLPLTNYNVFVLDQTLKNNSSISLVNTNVLRNGSSYDANGKANNYDANVTSALFDFNNKKNSWNIGGSVSVSNTVNIEKNKRVTGYAHSISIGKTSGRFNFNVWQELTNDKYDKKDLGYFTNNNSMDHGLYMGYSWNKPKYWYNRMRINFNSWYGRLVSPIDNLKRKALMFQNMGFNINGNAQTKKLRSLGFNFNKNFSYNDFYEPRIDGRVFRNKGSIGINIWYESNSTKKYSWGGNVFTGTGGVFKRTSLDYNLFGKARFSSKFSVDYSISINNTHDQPGFATRLGGDTSIFSRRDIKSIENSLNIKYNFTNRMGLSLSTTHNWSKVDPQQFYQLDAYGDLQPSTYNGNLNQNFNYLSVDMIYSWQFAQGSFITLAWKDIGGNFEYSGNFENKYLKNLGNTIDGHQFNSLSLRVIYFLDYLTVKNKLKARKAS